MKQKSLPKYTFYLVAGLSLAAFLYVNVHAALANQALSKKDPLEQSAQNKVQDGSEPRDEQKSLPVPDVTVVVRLLEIAQKFIPGGN